MNTVRGSTPATMPAPCESTYDHTVTSRAWFNLESRGERSKEILFKCELNQTRPNQQQQKRHFQRHLGITSSVPRTLQWDSRVGIPGNACLAPLTAKHCSWQAPSSTGPLMPRLGSAEPGERRGSKRRGSSDSSRKVGNSLSWGGGRWWGARWRLAQARRLQLWWLLWPRGSNMAHEDA